MFSLHWREGASLRLERARSRAIAAVSMAMIGIAIPGVARCADSIRNGSNDGGVDTEHLFGFTEGADIGAAGEKNVELDSTSRFGRQGGSFANAAPELEFKYTAFQNFRISAAATLRTTTSQASPGWRIVGRQPCNQCRWTRGSGSSTGIGRRSD